MKLENLLIHIGYQKTGSSWLQKNLLDNHSLGFSSPFSKKLISEAIIYPMPLEYDIQQCKKQLLPKLIEAQDKGLLPVISRESLSGSLKGGGYDSVNIATRLSTTFPQAKILIIIREQKAMIYSTYKQLVNGGYSLTLKELFQLSKQRKKRIHRFELSRFEYHRLIQFYFSLFGTNRVLILPIELFVKDPKQFLEKIFSFCQLDCPSEVLDNLPFEKKENKSSSGAATVLFRIFNKWFRKELELNQTPLFFHIKGKKIRKLIHKIDHADLLSSYKKIGIKHQQFIAEQVKQIYQESNRITSNLIGINLEEYGYDFHND